MQQQEFETYAQKGFNRIPVYREVLSDLDTPLSVYLKLADGPYSYLFESVEGGERWGRYSMIGLPCRTTYKVRGKQVQHLEYDELISQVDVEDPLVYIEKLQQQFQVPKIDALPLFSGGLVGYFGYETIAHIEPKLAIKDKPDPLGVADIQLMLSEEVAVFDNLSGKLFLVVNADPEGRPKQAWHAAQRRLDQLVHRLRGPGPAYPEIINGTNLDESDFVTGFSQNEFEAAVCRSKEYIRAGDIMQVVLSQRLSVPFNARPVDVYRALRSLNPSPYLIFMDLGPTQVVSSSPEILMRAEAGEVVLRPIAGTRPRGATQETDEALEQELLRDPKELAEHLMLIDLGRNDIGRVAKTGSVHLTEKMAVERYSHVMHIVSEVRGTLKPEMGPIDVLNIL